MISNYSLVYVHVNVTHYENLAYEEYHFNFNSDVIVTENFFGNRKDADMK